MRGGGWWSDITVKDDERAFLARDGRFAELLGPGRHRIFDWTRRERPTW